MYALFSCLATPTLTTTCCTHSTRSTPLCLLHSLYSLYYYFDSHSPYRYAFPSLALPAKFVARCAEAGQAADEAWCLELMEATGIVCVPGSGCGPLWKPAAQSLGPVRPPARPASARSSTGRPPASASLGQLAGRLYTGLDFSTGLVRRKAPSTHA